MQMNDDSLKDGKLFNSFRLFKYRWGKGKKQSPSFTTMEGQKASLKWITVGGRTSAVDEKLQRKYNARAASDVCAHLTVG